MTDRQKSIVICLGSVWIGAVVIWQCAAIPSVIEDDIGAGMIPCFISVLVIALSFAKMAGTIREEKRGQKKQELKERTKPVFGREQLRNGIGTIILIALYVLLLEKVGFLILSILYLAVQIYLFCPKEKRSYPVIAAVSVIASSVIYFSFVYGLKLILPAGILRGII